MTARTSDVCVVGGGVMGAAAAYHLAAGGLRVILVERGIPGQEASGANAGTLAVQNKPIEAVRAVMEGLRIWEGLSEQLGMDVEYERRGGFRVAHSHEDLALLERQCHEQRARGVPTEMVRPADLRKEAPYLHPAVSGASYSPMDGMANPFLTVKAFLEAGRRLGVQVARGTEVMGIEERLGGGFLVKTEDGEIHGECVVAAAGVWNARLARMLGADLPIRTLVQQAMITTSSPPLFDSIVTHVKGHVTLKQQHLSGKIQIGGGWPGKGDEREGRTWISRSSLVGNVQVACDTIPELSRCRILRMWSGFEGRTPDKLLLAGPLGPEGFFVLGCASGGFTISPLGGEIIADQVLGRASRIELEPFQPRRFASDPHAASACAGSESQAVGGSTQVLDAHSGRGPRRRPCGPFTEGTEKVRREPNETK